MTFFVINTIGQNICQNYSPSTSLLVSSVLLLIPDRSDFFPQTQDKRKRFFFFPHQMDTVETTSLKLLAIIHPHLQLTHAC